MILIIRSKVDPDKLILDLRKRKYQFHIEPFMYFKRLYPKIILDPNAHYLVSSLQAINFLKKNKEIIRNGNFLVIGKKVKKEAFEATHTIVEHKGIRFYVGENNELIPYEGE